VRLQRTKIQESSRGAGGPRADVRLTLAVGVSLGLGTLPLAGREARAQSTRDETSSGDTVTRARRLFEQGNTLARERRWAEAAEAFRASAALRPTPPVLYNLGVSYEQSGAPIDALLAFHAFQRLVAGRSDPRTALAEAAVTRVARLVAQVRFDGDPPRMDSVRIDDRPARALPEGTLVIPPGQHHLTALRADGSRCEADLAATYGAEITLRCRWQTPSMGTLEASASSPGVLRIDGTAQGAGPISVRLPPGTHVIELLDPRGPTQRREVIVRPDAVVRVRFEAEGEVGTSLARRPAFWAVTGGVIVAGAAVSAAVAAPRPLEPARATILGDREGF
jgi:hypothetical protein